MAYLILIRHGQSRWNIANKFTGWVDVPLSERGVFEALQAAKDLEGLEIDVAFTSKLVRAHQTLFTVLASQQKVGVLMHDDEERQEWYLHPRIIEEGEIPVHQHAALNERAYGDLQGQDKDEAKERFGKEQVHIWRRSYDVAPPNGESLKDVFARAVPFFESTIKPLVLEGKNVIVSAHGNSLRAIIKYIENISDKDVPNLELPTGKPIVYKVENNTFVADNHAHSFQRPIHWTPPKTHSVHNA